MILAHLAPQVTAILKEYYIWKDTMRELVSTENKTFCKCVPSLNFKVMGFSTRAETRKRAY